MLRGIINGPVGSTSHEEGRRRSSFDGTEFQRLANGENFKLLRKREFFATLKFTSTCERGIEAFGAENFHGKGGRRRGEEGWTIRDPQNLVVETRRGATWRLRKVSIPPPPRKRVFHFPFLSFFFFFNFPSLDGLFNEGSMQELEKFPSKSRCSGNI